jgi:hypothetical protein
MIASSEDSKELAAAMAADDRPAVSRGESFRGRALQGADFGGEDLRGVDFTGANLRSANFRDARVGPKLWIGAVILSTALAAAVGAGVLIGLAVEGTRERLSSGKLDEAVVASVVIATLVILVASSRDEVSKRRSRSRPSCTLVLSQAPSSPTSSGETSSGKR